MSYAIDQCPLCHDVVPESVDDVVPWGRVWSELAQLWNASLPVGLRARHEAAGPARRVTCPRCDLVYFAGASAGDGAFYSALEAGGRYYEPWRWEFGWVGRSVRAGDAVLDVGCGRGDFLAHLRSLGAVARGIEANPTARAVAVARGFEVSAENPLDFAARGAPVDVATAFHVVEHVTDPAGFVRELAACVRPGGAVAISVPFRERTWREPFEVLDHPPHHLTWWALPQLARLADAAGLRWEAHAFEPLPRWIHRHAVEKSLHRAVAGAVPRVGDALGAAVGWAIARAAFAPGLIHLADLAGLRERMGARGMAVAVRMRKGA